MIALEDKRILVTREAQTTERFAEKIERYGGEPVKAPLITINCLPWERSLKEDSYDWVFFTSKNGVDCFLQTEASANVLETSRIATVGPKTATAIEAYGYQVDFLPSTYNAQVMASEFLSIYKEVHRILLVRGTLASPILPEAFHRVKQPFTSVEVYETVTNLQVRDTLHKALQKQIDFLTFTSPSIVDAFLELADKPEKYMELPAVCIGTTTEAHAKRQGFTQTIIPEHFTVEGMIEVMSDYIKEKGGESND